MHNSFTDNSFGRIWSFVSALFFAFAVYHLLPPDCPEASRRMAFIFMIAAIFWALEVIPLFATSLLVLILEIFLLQDPKSVQSATVFLNTWSNPVLILFFGSFILAQAFHKHKLNRAIAVSLLRMFHHHAYPFLLGLMITTATLSLCLSSNTATAALMMMVVAPFLADLKHEPNFKKGIVLAVAFAAAIGGIATPVSTPPNAIAVGMLAAKGIRIHFLDWMKMSMPLEIILLILMSYIIYLFFKPTSTLVKLKLEAPKLTFSAKCVLGIGIATTILWFSSSWHGISESVIALAAAGVLAGSGLVSKDDLKSISWDVLVLMWGGLALGVGMQVSGLADWIVGLPLFQHEGFLLVIIFAVTSALLSSFISNTATVNLLLPIALSIPGHNSVMLAIAITLASSFDIAFPVSTPPMAIAYGTGVVTVKEMLKIGTIFFIMANLIMLAGFQIVIPKTIGP